MLRTASSPSPSFFTSVRRYLHLAGLPLALLLAAVTALAGCASSEPPGDPTGDDDPPPTVRERLATSTDLFVSPTTSGGAITARRWTNSGWIAGDVPLVLDSGAVVAQVEPGGALTISTVDLLLAPIDLPYPDHSVAARLDRLKLDLAGDPAVVTKPVWTADDNSAHGSTSVSLILSWAVDIDGVQTMLGPQHLPPIPVDVVLDGDGSAVLANLTLDLTGSVWGWADLIDLRDLRLVVDTATN